MAAYFHSLINDFESLLSDWLPNTLQVLLRDVPVDSLCHPYFDSHAVQVDMMRLDALHPIVSGNKWFKLKYNLLQARQMGCDGLVSFGGAWSNHLHALSYVSQQLNIPCVGIVRGDELSPQSNAALQDMSSNGMQFQFVSRAEYREKRDLIRGLDFDLIQKPYVIPEGGDNWLGILGAASIFHGCASFFSNYTHVIVSVGTGCTFAGMRLGLPARIELLGVSALKGRWVLSEMHRRMGRLGYGSKWTGLKGNWDLLTEHHCGGFGRLDDKLLSFIQDFSHVTALELDPIYTGKTMMALFDMMKHRSIRAGSRVLFIHSGGLQGNRGFESG